MNSKIIGPVGGAHPLDSQVIELLGRNRLIDELLRAGLEVALPMRDRGIDLIAYADLDPRVNSFVACPIQMKAASTQTFGLNAKYKKIHNLLIAYIWHVNEPRLETTFALSYPEALQVAEDMGWTKTASWVGGSYTTTRPSTKLRMLLEPYRMTSDRWWKKVTGYAGVPTAG